MTTALTSMTDSDVMPKASDGSANCYNLLGEFTHWICE